MKKAASRFFTVYLCLLIMTGCSSQSQADKKPSNGVETVKVESNQMDEESGVMFQVNMTVGSQTFSASLYDTETVRAFMKRLPMTLTMEDLHGNEKYFYSSYAFPTSAQLESQIHTGDIKLFGSDCLVLFYKDFPTSFFYTSLGQIDDPQGLQDAIGSGSVSISFENAK